MNQEDLQKLAKGVQNALTFDIVLSILNLISVIGLKFMVQRLSMIPSILCSIAWLVLIIIAFNSGYRQRPIPKAHFLSIFKVIRLIYYWIMIVSASIFSCIYVILGIILVSVKNPDIEMQTFLRIMGIVLLVCTPLMLLFIWLGYIGVKINKHFDRLLEADAADPQRAL